MMDDRWRWERRNRIDITPGPANNPTDDDAYRQDQATRLRDTGNAEPEDIVVLVAKRVEIMRWGFSRSFNPVINNARSDKLESGMWAEAFRERRCVIPVSAFYEWAPGIGGRKQAHEILDLGDDYLRIAGIWEETPELGNKADLLEIGRKTQGRRSILPILSKTQ